jgi:hypothetical protein
MLARLAYGPFRTWALVITGITHFLSGYVSAQQERTKTNVSLMVVVGMVIGTPPFPMMTLRRIALQLPEERLCGPSPQRFPALVLAQASA